MNDLEFYQKLIDSFDDDKHLGIATYYTFGGPQFQAWGQKNPDKIEGVVITMPVADGSPEYQSFMLDRALDRHGKKSFVKYFQDRFYLAKSLVPKPLVGSIPWLKENHRSAAFKVSIKHEKETFKETLKHTTTLSILFHKDFKTLEEQLEQKTLRLSKVKNAREMRNQSEKDTSIGTAFPVRIEDSIYFITAKHVVNDTDRTIEINDVHNNTYYCKPGLPSSFDIQLLNLENDITYDGPAFALTSIEEPEISDEVFVCGYPEALGSKPTISLGHISKLNADFNGSSGLIQISSAAVNPNNSGGPVTDYRGNVIGVLVLRGDADRFQNIAFVEPIHRALRELGALK